MTADFRLTPVYYPATYLRRTSLSRLVYLFGRLRLLQPPGLGEGPREGLGGIIEPVTLSLRPERARLLEAVLADYLRWAAEHQGASYTLYLHNRSQAREETLSDLKSALRGVTSPRQGEPAPEDLSWQVLLRLAHDYDRQQEEIEAILERVRHQESQLAELTGLSLDEMDTGPAGFELPGEGEPPEDVEELTAAGRMAAFGRLWLATGCEGTPVTASVAAHECVLEAAGGEPLQFELELPDAARLPLAEALSRRTAASGPLEGLSARLATLQALCKARGWSEEVRAEVNVLFGELGEAAARVCREAELPARLRLKCTVIPKLDAQRLFARLAGQAEPEETSSGLYLLLEGA
jgi:hypothetical protein